MLARSPDAAASRMPPPLAQLELAGVPVVRIGSGGVPQALAPLDAALLAWLAIEGATPRARLASMLWPRKDEDAARNLLRQRLFRQRRVFGAELVVGHTTLALAEGVVHDLEDAEGVLGDSASPAEGDYAQWLAVQRERRRSRMRLTLSELSEMAERARDFEDALQHARELLVLEPLSEAAHRRLMRLHYLKGDRAAALLAFDACERMLKDEVGAKPSPETMALLQVVEQAAPGTAGAAPSPSLATALLRPPRLVGRAVEWAALTEAWDTGRIAVVTGDAGMGKSRLLEEFVQGREAVVLARARPGDDRVVYGTLSRLLRALPRAALERLPPALQREVARLLPEWDAATAAAPEPEAPAAGDPEGTRFANAMAAALEHTALALEGFAVDDLHFADDASVELVRYVAGGGRRRWLLASRPAEGGAAARAMLEDRAEAGRVAQVALSPLDAAQVAELLTTLALDRVADLDPATLAPGLVGRCGGNPLYLLETLKALVADTLQGDTGAARSLVPVGVPRRANAAAPALLPGIAPLVQRRIGQLSAQAVRLARCAAVAVPDFDIALAGHVLGLKTVDLADPWAELEAAQVFRDGGFAHDLIRDAALASVPAPVARQLHAEIAAYLAGHGGAPARVAEHWLAAGREREALPALASAAAQAQSTMRRAEEAALRRRIADIAERLGERDAAYDALLALIAAMHVADRSAMDDALFDRLRAAATTPQQRLHAEVVHTNALSSLGRYEDTLAVGERAAEQARRAGQRAEECETLRTMAAAAAHRGEAERALHLLQRATPWLLEHGSVAERQSLHNDLGCCLDAAGRLREAVIHHERAVELAVAAGDLHNATIACANLGANRKFAGRLREALDLMQRARRYALAFDAAQGTTWNIDLNTFSLHRELAQYDEALRMADMALQAVEQHPAARPAARLHVASLWVQLGQAHRAAPVLAELLESGLAPHLRSRHARLAGLAARQSGQHVEAERQARAALEFASAAGRAGVLALARLEQAAERPAAEALALCEAECSAAAARGHEGTALAARIRATGFAVAAGDTARAAAMARAVLAAPADVTPDDLYPAERWVQVVTALQAAGDGPAARAALERGHAELMAIAARVPEELRAGFLERVPPNRELRALHARQQARR